MQEISKSSSKNVDFSRKRVVVTGMGVLSPLGYGCDVNWNKIKNHKSGVVKLSDEYDKIPSRVAGLVPRGNKNGEFEINDFATSVEQRRNGLFISYGVAAVQEAIIQAKLDQVSDRNTIATCISSGIGGLPELYETCRKFSIDREEYGSRKINPFFIPSVLTNLAPGFIAIKFDFKGPNYGTSSACASASHAISDAYMMIQQGHADIVVAGGTEASICPLGVGGFAALKALSTKYNETPELASRPFDKNHDGFVIGEGAGVLVLESLESAQRRNCDIYAELVSSGMSCDASHITAPNAIHSARAMATAINRAGIDPSSIGYLNAHATSTPLGDRAEIEALKSVFKDHAYSDKFAVSSTKSYTGHLLGAAGGIESVFSVLALKNQELPATLNVTDPIDEIKNINYIKKVQKHDFEYAMSNSFGFGGTNISLIFKKF